jgi:TetR/AcrR family transcriptional repressor of nem operon
VLEAAMNCFWAQGFEQTSVRELAERMGITGASLYNAFGDKRSLYRQAFVHYLAQTVRDRVARLERLPPALAIRTFFDEIIARSVDDEQRRGCMLVNAALELEPYDPEFQRLIVEEMMFIEAFFCRCVTAGQKDSSIIGTRRADEVAKLLLSVLLGIRVLARSRPQREVLEGAANGVLALLGCPDFETRPWVTGPALSQRRVAIVSSAGLVVRGENPFRGRDPDYRAIPSTIAARDLLCSHISINFDRTGFQEDWNVVFPLDRLNDLAAEGTIGSVATMHYAFMGATDPVQMEPYARELAGRLKADAVDAAILPPV